MKWCIKVTSENLPIVGKWFNENSQNVSGTFKDISNIGIYYHYPMYNDKYHSNHEIQDDYTELTFEQFKEQILKEPNVLQEILDKLKSRIYYDDYEDEVVDFKDIEQIFSNYLNK